MIVVSNATPIITLASINQIDILKHFFSKVYIPQAVYDEIKYWGNIKFTVGCCFPTHRY